MTIDASAYCPGGTGKKIKHCMCRDIGGELAKILRALEGNQRVAAMDRINRALATNAHRPCLLSLKILTLLEMNELQNLDETVTTFVKVAPENSLAHTFAALLEIRKERPKEAVDCLQAAIYWAKENFPGELYDALGAVAQALASDNQYLAARGHLLFRAMIGDQDDDAVNPLLSISSAGNVPALLKRDLIFVAGPEGVPWMKPFNAACAECARGAWKSGLEAFDKLDQEYPGQAVILRNIATARSYLGYGGAADAWHKYAQLESVDLDEAVTAEATSQLLEYEVTRKTIGVVKLTFNVSDANALQERMLSSKEVVSIPIGPTAMGDEGSPPPKGVFQVADRSVPPSETELTLDNLPHTVCQALLYGKETDREARLEILIAKDGQFESTREAIAKIADDLLLAEEAEEVLDTVPVETAELFPKLLFPDETGLSARRRLTSEATSAAFRDKWATLPMTALDDRSPQEVAGDPAYRTRLSAALLVLEQIAEVESWPVDVDQLREQLGLPVKGPIGPTDFDLATLQPQDWHRVEPEKLDDDKLLNLYRQAAIYSARRAIQRLGTELLRRGEIEGVDMAAVAGGLAQLSDDPDESLELLRRARSLAQKSGDSPARWYLAELPLQLIRGDVSAAQHTMTVLQTQHIREPGVSQALFKILVQFGIVTPDGRLAGQEDDAPAAAAAPEPDQRIWTSDSAPQPAAGQKQESKLWVPGMD